MKVTGCADRADFWIMLAVWFWSLSACDLCRTGDGSRPADDELSGGRVACGAGELQRVNDELADELKQEMRIICGAWHLFVLSLVSRLAGPPGGVSPPARLLSCISSVAPLPHRLLRPAMLGGLDGDPSPSSSESSSPRSEFKDGALLLGRRCADRAGGDTAFGSTLRKDSAGGACED